MRIWNKTTNGALVRLEKGDLVPEGAGWWDGWGFGYVGEPQKRLSSWLGDAPYWGERYKGQIRMESDGYTWWPDSLLREAGLL